MAKIVYIGPGYGKAKIKKKSQIPKTALRASSTKYMTIYYYGSDTYLVAKKGYTLKRD